MSSGIAACRYEIVCMTDGDDEYEVEDFRKLLKLKDHYDLIITFRYRKIYSSTRIFVSWVYNMRAAVPLPHAVPRRLDGLRLVRRAVLAGRASSSRRAPSSAPSWRSRRCSRATGSARSGIQTFPRSFGSGSSTSIPNILATIRDMWRIYHRVFSDAYDLPSGRARR